MAQKERLPRGEWRTSSKSGPDGGNCVKLRAKNGVIEVCDSKADGHKNRIVLGVSEAAMRALFTATQRDNLFGDLTAEATTIANEIVLRGREDGGFDLNRADDETRKLHFTEGELDAFVADVLAEAEGEGNFVGMMPDTTEMLAVA